LILKTKQLFLCLLLGCGLLPYGLLWADNSQANESFKEALEEEQDGDFYSAAKEFKASYLFADDTMLKARALEKAARCYGKAGYLFKEYENLESAIKGLPTHINFVDAVNREYEIGNKFFEGHRDPAFNALDWVPWLKGPNKCMEIYESALKNAPFSKYAPETRLRLGRLYLNADKVKEALDEFRKTISMYPDTESAKYARLELANALLQLAEFGDGDGKYARETEQVLSEYLEKYPNDSEKVWVEQTLKKIREISANRLYGMAAFYHRKGRSKAATRYLSDVIRDYPNSETADQSEELLSDIDSDYKVTDKPKKKFQYIYRLKEMPPEESLTLVVPENSNGKWLLPVEDLELGEVNRDHPLDEIIPGDKSDKKEKTIKK
jgi:outer membrane protein assembly factor BamD